MKYPRWRISRLFMASAVMVPLLLACSPQNGQDSSAHGQQPVNAPRFGVPVMEELVSLGYSGIHEEPVTLADGRWEGEPFEEGAASRPVVGLVDDFYLRSDLDGDGSSEAVVILWESSGGSGSNSYVAVVSRHDGIPVNIATALIGDRVQLRTGRISNGMIELDVVQQGPNDAACCPAETVTRVWKLDTGELNEITGQATGRLSLADLDGQEWLLQGMSRDEPVPPGLEVTLVFMNGRVAGHGACNHYFGSVAAGASPGDIVLSKLGSTRKACAPAAMELEERYLSTLPGVSRFGFLNGKLALSWQQDGGVNSLLFAPRTP
jgi:heat shock protein HslJ